MDQNQNIPPTAPVQENSPFPKTISGENKSSLILVGACAVVLALVLLGWYMMSRTQIVEEVIPMETAPEVTAANETAPAEAAVVAFETQGSSDEVAAIEADITATDFSSLNDTNQI